MDRARVAVGALEVRGHPLPVARMARGMAGVSAEDFYAALGVELAGTGPKASVRCFHPDAHKHDDRNPSAEVYREKGTWHCYGCGEWGGPYKAALAHGLSEREAMALVAEHGLDVKEGDERSPRVRTEPKPTPDLATTEADLERHRQRLAEDQDALERLEELRGWTAEAITGLGLGLDDAGRITFPIHDADRQLVGALRYQPNPERRQGRKLKADPGSRRELFPAPETLEPGDRYMLLVEGEPDAVAAASLDVPAVAVPGVGKWQPSWAERFAGRRVVVCLDSDEAGRRAAHERAEALVGHAAEVRVIDLAPDREDGYDLGDWTLEASRDGGLRSGRHALEQLVKYAEPLDSFESVGLADVLEDLVRFVRCYVVMSDAQATTAALWILHTHVFGSAEATPYLSISSAEKESGKTRLLEVLELLVARPWLTGRVTAAVLARKVDAESPTLLLDESDAAFKGEQEYAEALRGLLNTGHRRGGKSTVCVGQGANIDYKDFSTFCPKAIAGIGALPDTVASRAVHVRLRRRAPDERVERFRHREARARGEPLRERLEEWANTQEETLSLARPDLPDELGDRAQDSWEPLLAIADLAGEEWANRARRGAVELSGRGEAEDGSIGVQLLSDIRDVLHGRISSADLLDGLAALEEAPWGDWYGKPLTSRTLAKLLKPYGVKSRSVRLEDGSTPKGFQREQFEDAWKRYLPTTPASKRHSATTRMGSGKTADLQTPHDPFVADSPEAAKPHGERDVAVVADRGWGEAA